MTVGPKSQSPPPLCAPTPLGAPTPPAAHHDHARVSCDGGGALGHPRVWLQFPPASSGDQPLICPYCGEIFTRAPSPPPQG